MLVDMNPGGGKLFLLIVGNARYLSRYDHWNHSILQYFNSPLIRFKRKRRFRIIGNGCITANGLFYIPHTYIRNF